MSCSPRLTLLKRIPIRKGFRQICLKKTSSPRKRGQPSTTIKTPIPSPTKVRIIYPSSGTLELWTRDFSNLTIGGYLAGTTPVLLLRSSVFVLCRFLSGAREDRVAHWWFFRHHQDTFKFMTYLSITLWLVHLIMKFNHRLTPKFVENFFSFLLKGSVL